MKETLEYNENTTSYSSLKMDEMGIQNIQLAGKWAKFIGIVFSVLASIILLTVIAIFANLDKLLIVLTEFSGMSYESLVFFTDSGKYAFILFFLIIIGVLVMNAAFLIRFRNGSEKYFLNGDEDELVFGLRNLKKYLIVTVVLGICSSFITFLGVLTMFFIS